MCGVQAALPLLGLLGTTAVSGMMGGGGGSTETYQARTATTDSQGMEQSMQTPSVSLSDKEAGENGRVRKNRQGRNVFRVDRTAPASSGLGSGSGVNVPGI